jgi:hypothetical protein
MHMGITVVLLFVVLMRVFVSLALSDLGWGSFSVAVMGGLYFATNWADERGAVQTARGSKDTRPMSFEEKVRACL